MTLTQFERLQIAAWLRRVMPHGHEEAERLFAAISELEKPERKP